MYVCMNFKCCSCIVCLFLFARSYQFLSFYFPKDFSMFAYYVYNTTQVYLAWLTGSDMTERRESIYNYVSYSFACTITIIYIYYSYTTLCMYVHISLIERTKLHKIKKKTRKEFTFHFYVFVYSVFLAFCVTKYNRRK